MKQLNWYQIFGNAHIIPDGKTVTPTDDIQTLLHCANIWDKDYTTLAEVLADDDTLFLICISDNAIDYLVRSTSWASYNDIVPKMTSNTSPSGICFGYNTYSGLQPYYSFDQNYDDNWASRSDAYGYVGYIFDTPQVLGAISMDSYYLYKCVIEGSNDTTTGFDGTWEQIGDEITVTTYGDDSQIHSDISVFNGKAYKAYRLYITSGKGGGSSRGAIRILQFHTPSIVNNATAMQYIGASDYASETLLSDSTWLTAIDGSAYKDYVINAKVPTMTSNTAPYGTAFAYGELSGYEAYKAFDNNDTTLWQGRPGALVGTIGYCFVNPVKVAQVKYRDKYGSKQVTLSHSDNGTDYTVASESATITSGETNYYFSPSSLSSHRYWRVNITATESSYFYVETLQFSGRQNAGVQTWLKAGGVEGKKYTTVSEVLSDLTTLATLMSSTDAIDYLVTAKGWATEICSDSNAMADIGMNNYAANTLLADETWAEAIGNSTYFTSVLNVSVPAMTDNTHPYGECFASNAVSYAWMAFNGTNTGTSDMWSSDNAVPQSIGYKFSSPVRIAKVMIANRKGASPGYIHSVREFALEASNDGVTYTKIKDFLNTNNTQGAETYYSNAIGTTYTYYRINISSTNESNTPYIGRLQFYGRKDI